MSYCARADQPGLTCYHHTYIHTYHPRIDMWYHILTNNFIITISTITNLFNNKITRLRIVVVPISKIVFDKLSDNWSHCAWWSRIWWDWVVSIDNSWMIFHVLIFRKNSETQTFLYNTEPVSHDWFISCQCFDLSVTKFFKQAQAENEIFIWWNCETNFEVTNKMLLRLWIEALKQFLHHQVKD